jgi:hypothetical protein
MDEARAWAVRPGPDPDAARVVRFPCAGGRRSASLPRGDTRRRFSRRCLPDAAPAPRGLRARDASPALRAVPVPVRDAGLARLPAVHRRPSADLFCDWMESWRVRIPLVGMAG